MIPTGEQPQPLCTYTSEQQRQSLPYQKNPRLKFPLVVTSEIRPVAR